jgi:DNA-binding response OmpR family regulator
MSQSKNKILIVEDEPGLQKALKISLEENGYEVAQAFNGEEGIAMVKSAEPDLILLDLILPKKNGFEMLDTLNAERSTTPVIVLTNLEGGNDIEKATLLGAKAYLIKADYTLEEIVNRIGLLMKEYLPK